MRSEKQGIMGKRSQLGYNSESSSESDSDEWDPDSDSTKQKISKFVQRFVGYDSDSD